MDEEIVKLENIYPHLSDIMPPLLPLPKVRQLLTFLPQIALAREMRISQGLDDDLSASTYYVQVSTPPPPPDISNCELIATIQTLFQSLGIDMKAQLDTLNRHTHLLERNDGYSAIRRRLDRQLTLMEEINRKCTFRESKDLKTNPKSSLAPASVTKRRRHLAAAAAAAPDDTDWNLYDETYNHFCAEDEIAGPSNDDLLF